MSEKQVDSNSTWKIFKNDIIIENQIFEGMTTIVNSWLYRITGNQTQLYRILKQNCVCEATFNSDVMYNVYQTLISFDFSKYAN